MERGSDADRFVVLGNEHSDAGRAADAETAYRAAAEADPAWSVPWYNLGLLCKYQKRWRECIAFNQRAVSLNPEDGDAWWNLGIAAKARGLRKPDGGRDFEVCVYVDDVDRTVEGLRVEGVPVTVEPHDRAWGERVAYVADPDGNTVMLTAAAP